MIKAVQQIMLGSVTGNERAARETLGKIKEAGYDGIELNGFMIRPVSWKVRMLTKLAGMPTGKGGNLDWAGLTRDAGLQVVSVHQDLGAVEQELKTVVSEAKKLGTDKAVITGMYRFDYSDAGEVDRLCERLNAAGKALKENGIMLLYHNHNCEWRRISKTENAYDRIIAGTDPDYVNFEFDSYWPTEAGVDALAVMKKLGERVKLYHINDRGTKVTGPSMTPILKSDSMELGTGNMNLPAFTEQAKRAGVQAVILESHKNWIDKSPIASLEKSAEFLNKYV